MLYLGSQLLADGLSRGANEHFSGGLKSNSEVQQPRHPAVIAPSPLSQIIFRYF